MTSPTDFLIHRNLSKEQEQDEIKDIQDLHILRGRLLHYTSIIERIMKEYCGLANSRKTFGQIKPDFIKMLSKNGFDKKLGFDEFLKALKNIKPERDAWAHGFVHYEPRAESEKANNFLTLNKTASLTNYFDSINKDFTTIINWLMNNGLWKINGFNLVYFNL